MRLLLRVGALSGLAAGVALATFMATAGRSPIRAAIDYEQAVESHDHSVGAMAHEDLFSRGAQEIGGVISLVIFGVLLGVLFAVVLGAVGSRLPQSSTLAATCWLAVVGFVTVVLVPFLKYPANPPAVGDPNTITQRTLLYFAALSISLALTLIVWNLWQRSEGWGIVRRFWTAAAAYGVGVAVILLALPDNGDVADAPADLVWSFRLASLGGLLVAWTVLGLTSGTLLSRWSDGVADLPS